MGSFTHLDPQGRPAMVDVGAKPVTFRRARAEARVWLPPEVAARLEDGELDSAKGPVWHTAVLAGVLAAKRTGELIPLCHPLPLEHVGITIQSEACAEGGAVAVVRCEASLHGRTGVEMEALTGAALAALTIVDMCKALSHELRVDGLRLLDKEGGRRTVRDGRLLP
jgi:cyclic pyranopterin phosphate synthase